MRPINFEIKLSSGQSEAPPFEPAMFKAIIKNLTTQKQRMIEATILKTLLEEVTTTVLSSQ